jgi:hypothetical protein
MLPSEKAERWVRRVGYAALILIALYIVVWLTRFIWGNYHKALEQRQFPSEATAPVCELLGSAHYSDVRTPS